MLATKLYLNRKAPPLLEIYSLDEEHNEAISAMLNARHAINDINYEIIKKVKS